MTTFRTSIRDAWRLATPYFRTDEPSGLRFGRVDLAHVEEKWIARALLAIVLGINVAQVGLSVLLNQWNGRFYNALQAKNLAAFSTELGIFAVLAAIFIALAVYELYLTQALVLRWRTWMTRRFLSRWTDGPVHYRMRLAGDHADNPDQRIAEDVQQFASGTLTIGIQVFSSLLSLSAFAVVLWGLSAGFPYKILGFDLAAIPGYLLWLSLLYAVLGTVFAHLIGRPLAALDAERQRREADFRFGLARLRENAEPVALLKGEAAERRDLSQRFDGIFANTLAIMRRRKALTFFTASYQQFSIIAPFLLLSPAYFGGRLGLGALTQTAGAIGNVQNSLSVFVSLYAALADYRAVVVRLSGFDGALEQARRPIPDRSGAVPVAGRFRIGNFEVRNCDGSLLVAVPELAAVPGDRILVMGPSGSGKTTLMRALAGLWPHASGQFDCAPGAKLMLMPQQPYVPWGTLRSALIYPAIAARSDVELRDVLAAVKLSHLAGRLDEAAPWHRILSVGEAQRLAFARAILHAPESFFLDEATSAVDEETEQLLYRALFRRLPDTVIVSIGHRSSLVALHARRVMLVPSAGGGHVLCDAGSGVRVKDVAA